MGMMDDMRGMRTPTSFTRRALLSSVALGALTVALAACGSEGSNSAADTTSAGSGELTISGAWARTSPSDAANGAAYFTITSPTADTLTGVKVDASVAGTAEMHETKMVTTGSSMPMGSDTTMAMGGDTTMPMGGSDTTMNMGGGMTMVPVDSVDIPAGEAVVFEPGGKHIMLMELAKPLEKGATFELTLTFKNAGDKVVTVTVADEAP